MKNRLNNVEGYAIHGIFAASLGILLFYIRDNWHGISVITGTVFEVIYIMAFYMYLPFVLSLVYHAIFSYAKAVLHDRNQIFARTVFLLGTAVLMAGYIIFGLQEGTILIISLVCVAFQVLRRQ